MLKNYLTIAWRNLQRQLLYSFINIAGLAVGMACSLVIFLYAYGEWSHDRHFKHADRIYRIGVSFFNMGPFAVGPELLGEYLPKAFEGIEAFTQFTKDGREIINVNNQVFNEVVYYVDTAFFRVFSYPFMEGNATQSLRNISSAVLTESMALKYFNDIHVLGKTIEVGKKKMPYVITGIVKDEHRNSHLKTSIWLSWKLEDKKYHWTSASVFNYALLRANVSEKDLNRALDQIIEKQIFPVSGKLQLEDYLKSDNRVKFFVHPLKDIYLKSKLNFEVSPGGNETNMQIFSVVALFILILAGVNFINLSTARATRRAKEVGIRKSLGTSKGRLVTQFLLESVMISTFSMILALCLAELFTFAYFWITGQHLMINLWTDLYSILWIFIFAIVVGVLAGIYPALYLTAFQPAKVLKGSIQLTGSPIFRNALVVFQFSISIALIICAAIIIRQLNFMAEKDLGFDQENVVTIDNVDLLGNSASAFRDELMSQQGVLDASLHAGEPGSKAVVGIYVFQTEDGTDELTISTYFADDHYIDAMGFRLLQGRNFDRNLASDSLAVILNESAIRSLNIKGDPIGLQLSSGQKVIGVVSDFHWESLRSEIAPIAIIQKQQHTSNVEYSQLALKFNSKNASSILTVAGKKWKQFIADEPIKYHFLDENFDALLKKEEILGKAIAFFTVLAILISCLGLFGLAAYTTEQRTKEIGIRKVLGATVTNIVLMLNRQFTVLVLVAMLFAIPVSYFAADQWLSGFAYRTDMSIWIFIACSFSGLMICCATVAFHSVKASRTNPAETLKWE